MSADLMTSSSEQPETVAETAAMDTAPAEEVASNAEDKTVNGTEEESTETDSKASKRKRPTKKSVEPVDTISNGRPKRTLSKREDVPTSVVNGTPKATKSKVEQTPVDDDDEQERDKNIPIAYDVADVVWVKMGGHPWWPSLIIRDPNDPNTCFTKIAGNARAKRMYFVVFYGSTADFAWVYEGAIIPYNGVEAFTKYAQETVDKAVTKSQKEQLTERFQLKVTIGRREDWEAAVREADEALTQSNDTRVENIEPKLQFYTKKLVPKSQPARRPKSSTTKAEESSEAVDPSTLDPADRSLLAEKTFEFKSEDEESSNDLPLRKTPTVKIKLSKQASNDSDSNPTPPSKRRYVRKSVPSDEKQPSTTSVFGQTTNGSSVSYQQRTASNHPVDTTPVKTTVNGSSGSGKKRGRPRVKQASASSSNEDSPAPEFNSASPTVTTKFTTQRKPIVKPQAFMNSATSHLASGQHDIRTGFLSPFEEQEVLDALDQLGSTKTFEEAEQKARRRFEHILCLNLNRTHVDVPPEWFYTFLFSHPALIIKNPQWFGEKNNSEGSNDNDLLSDVQTSSSLAVLKHQLVVLSKLYRQELQPRQSAPVAKRRSTGSSPSKRKSVEKNQDVDDDEQLENDEELIN